MTLALTLWYVKIAADWFLFGTLMRRERNAFTCYIGWCALKTIPLFWLYSNHQLYSTVYWPLALIEDCFLLWAAGELLDSLWGAVAGLSLFLLFVPAYSLHWGTFIMAADKLVAVTALSCAAYAWKKPVAKGLLIAGLAHAVVMFAGTKPGDWRGFADTAGWLIALAIWMGDYEIRHRETKVSGVFGKNSSPRHHPQIPTRAGHASATALHNRIA